ncbi:MAG: regulatory protein RecX [bacterium]
MRLDDGRTLAVPEDAWRELKLSPPGPVEPETLRTLERVSELHRLRRRALVLLAVRPRSARELFQRLARVTDAKLASQVVSELERRGLVDDRRFALEWVRSRQASRGLGPARLRFELLRKGIAREFAEAALREAGAEEEALAVEVARRQLPRYARQPPEVAVRRLAGYLARRGFGPAAVSRALRAVGLPGNAAGEEATR